MGKQKRMDQIRLIIKTYSKTQSYKATARQLHISKNTVKNYIGQARLINEDLSKVLELSEPKLIEELAKLSDYTIDQRGLIFNKLIDYWLKELKRVGVTRHLLWEEYKNKHLDGYGYSQFCDRLKRYIESRNLTIELIHNPGEVMQIDFAGKKMSWVDIHSGEIYDCEILVIVMPFSQYGFVMALPSQKVEDFIHGINEAFLYFGKLPSRLLSDNLKSYVTRADKYEPKFNELCVQLSAHYGIELQATRVRKPKDKASVENAVNNTYRRIYAPLRNETFYSIEELNEAIRDQLAIHNTMAFQKKQGSRKELFETYEEPEMRALPTELFEIKKQTKAKVQKNYHVFIGEEKNYYSVPYKYVGKQALIRYNKEIVEIYIGQNRVSVHNRLGCKDTYSYQTNNDHVPKSHQQWKEAQGYDALYFIDQAQRIGPSTHWLIKQTLVSKIYEVQAYKSCMGILSMARKYSSRRLEQAALRCQNHGKGNYQMIKRILSKNLDYNQQSPDLKIPEHDNIRGPQAYQ